MSVTNDSVYTVILYDPDTRVDMNESVLSQIANDLPAEVLREGGPNEKACISYVSSACDVYVRRPDMALTQVVDSLLSLLATRYSANF